MLDVVEGHIAMNENSVHDVDDDGFTGLHHAARYNRVEVVKCLLDAGAGQ